MERAAWGWTVVGSGRYIGQTRGDSSGLTVGILAALCRTSESLNDDLKSTDTVNLDGNQLPIPLLPPFHNDFLMSAV